MAMKNVTNGMNNLIDEMFELDEEIYLYVIETLLKEAKEEKEDKELHDCVCALKVLMEKGCQCGGK